MASHLEEGGKQRERWRVRESETGRKKEQKKKWKVRVGERGGQRERERER